MSDGITTGETGQGGRWFGVVRKRDGDVVIAARPLSVAHTQDAFLRQFLGYEEGDAVLDILFNDTLEFRNYQELWHETLGMASRRKRRRRERRKA